MNSNWYDKLSFSKDIIMVKVKVKVEVVAEIKGNS